MLDHAKFRKSLRNLIRTKYGTTSAFQRDLQFNWTTIHRWTSDKHGTWPKADKLILMSRAFGISIEELLLGERLDDAGSGAYSAEHMRLLFAARDPDVLKYLLQSLDAVENTRKTLKAKEARLNDIIKEQE